MMKYRNRRKSKVRYYYYVTQEQLKNGAIKTQNGCSRVAYGDFDIGLFDQRIIMFFKEITNEQYKKLNKKWENNIEF